MAQYKKDSTAATIATSAIVFCLFSFLYIYCYQTPTLAYEQHVLSGGITVYYPLISAIIITIVCQVLQLTVYGFTKLHGASHALTYVPSMLLLAFLTCGRPDGNGGLQTGMWIWFVPVLLLIYFCLIKVVKQWLSIATPPAPWLFSQQLTLNLLTMVAMMLFVLNVGNGDELFHRQIRAEKLLKEWRYTELAKEGQGRSLLAQLTENTFFENEHNTISEQTDSTLTLLRFIAMDKLGTLADSAFTQPVVGGTASLMKLENIHPLLFDIKFLKRRKSFDYKLCAILADRDLDLFAKELSRRVNVNDSTARDSLPRHYREALILYQHQRSRPITNYVDPVLETDYNDMMTAQRQCATIEERRMILRQNYRNNYWGYFGQLYLKELNQSR